MVITWLGQSSDSGRAVTWSRRDGEHPGKEDGPLLQAPCLGPRLVCAPSWASRVLFLLPESALAEEARREDCTRR